MNGKHISAGRRRTFLLGLATALLGLIVLVLQPISASAATAISINEVPNCGTKDFCYTPASASSTVGTQVVWTNQGGSAHTVTRCTAGACGTGGGSGTDSTFVNSGTIQPGGKFTHTFTSPGTYVYYCQIHGYTLQRGTITIAGSTGSTTTTPTTRPSSTTTTTVAGGRPTASVGDVALTEGDAKTRTAYFPVTLSKASTQTITVNYATATGTAGSGDFAAKSGTLTFAAGKVKANIAVPVKGDVADEADETFSLNLSAPVNATVADGTGTGTIRDDDPGSGLRLTVGDVTVYEGNSGTQTATFTVSLSGPATSDVTVAYATGDQSAVQPGDYAVKTGTLTFAAGVVNKNVAVTVKSNTGAEPDETFAVTLSNPTGGATVADNTGVGTIRNDD